jgi:hypothetical protein
MLVPVFWSKDGNLLGDYLEKGVTIMAKYYVSLLDKLKQQLVSKQAFEKNPVSSRQFCSSQGGHYTPQIGGSSF